MTDRLVDVSDSVRTIIALRVSRLHRDDRTDDETPLGSEGLGLDSIGIAEALLDCERRFGIRLGDLLDGTPITIRRIAARVAQTASA